MVRTVGIPRALVYYYYYPQWKTFFEDLGFKVVVSDKTSKRIVDLGVKITLNDACIPIKLVHGHILDLMEKKVDALFVPRLVSLDSDATLCPKFLGLPDMVRSKMDKLPVYIDERLDNRRRGYTEEKFYIQVGNKLGKTKSESLAAFRHSKQVFEDYRKLLTSGLNAFEAMEILDKGKNIEEAVKEQQKKNTLEISETGKLHFAVIGYVYLIYDDFVNANLLKKLDQLGAVPHLFDQLPEEGIAAQAEKMPRELFWMFSNRVVKGAFHYLSEDKIDGIIHVSAFGCGPDAMTTKLIEIQAKYHTTIPYMRILVDEHTGEAGLMTRLESFTDMIRRKGVRKK